MRKILFWVAVLVLIAVYPHHYLNVPAGRAEKVIRVRMIDNTALVNIRIQGGYALYGMPGNKLILEERNSSELEVLPSPDGIMAGGADLPFKAIRFVSKKYGNIWIGDNQYRGVIEIIKNEYGNLRVINYLNIEEYLYGVLPYESPKFSSLEALMAQAIVSRTFALYRKEQMRDKEYDVTDDTSSQVYGGVKGEGYLIRKAVDLTSGYVLTYAGKLIPAYFHSTCGGITEDDKDVWGSDSPGVNQVICGYCTLSPYYKWESRFTIGDIEGRLGKIGIQCPGLKSIRPGERLSSGRLKSIRLYYGKNEKTIPVGTLRAALGTKDLKSDYFRISVGKPYVVIRGRGFGHGVGMCQWGAFWMAVQGKNYKQILNYYFPGTRIERI